MVLKLRHGASSYDRFVDAAETVLHRAPAVGPSGVGIGLERPPLFAGHSVSSHGSITGFRWRVSALSTRNALSTRWRYRYLWLMKNAWTASRAVSELIGILAFAGLVGFEAAAAAPLTDAISYNRDIRPILSNNCFACHGADSAARKANLRWT